jgi:uncharacterized protein with von Willebrand factor type A (vWA) domain
MTDMSQRVYDLFKRTKNLPALSDSVVRHDRLDDGVLEDMTERASHFRGAMFDVPEVDLDNLTDDEGKAIELSDEEREKVLEYVAWQNLFGDTFRALHTLQEPELKNQGEFKPSRDLNRRILQQIIASEKFQAMRPDTRHDEISAAFATINMSEGLRESLQEQMKEMVVGAKRMSDQEQQITGAQEALEQMRQQAAQEHQESGEVNPELKQAIKEQAQQKTQARQGLAEEQAEQQQKGIGVGAIEAIDQALEGAQEATDAIGSLPGTEPGSGQKLSPDEMIELAQKWKENPELFDMAKMIGRMQRDIRYRRTNRVVGGREEIIDVKLGDDLPLLLPSEKVKLRHPVLRRDFIRRFYERSLVQYETRGYAEAGRGPIIVCLDGSGSMNGMPNVWARSLAISFIAIAKREKRDAAAVEFSSYGQTKRWDFMAKEPINPLRIVDFASHMFHGGTDVTGGVEKAKELIDMVPEFKTADIVLMTDGMDYFQEDDVALRDELRERGVRLHGVAIGMKSNAYLEQMCDDTVAAWDLAGTNDATQHLAEAIT